MSEVTDTRTPSRFGALPAWLRIGIVAAGAVVLALIVLVIVRVVAQAPHIPLGSTPVDSLQPGSCVAEADVDAETYTVVSCSTPHPQQIVAHLDINYPGIPYSSDESLAIYADAVCDRLIEYKLFLPSDIVKAEFQTIAVSPPTLEEYNGGQTFTYCSIIDKPEKPGDASDDLTTDLYRKMP